MAKAWKVTVDGVPHDVVYKKGVFKSRKVVDGVETPIKSKSFFIQMIDEPVELGSKTAYLTAIGAKADLAVDDVYLGSGKPYVSLSNVPGWANGLAIALILIGWFLSGIFGILIGVFGGMFIISKSISVDQKNPLPVCVTISVACVVVDILIALLVSGIL
ncbi:MAG: hypothetical protein E7476_06940 [Ruminococcaceae bacterium]|nr:hypothetical protein [Oscillospiraceae bacterium]